MSRDVGLRSEARIAYRAMAERWPVTPEMRAKLVTRLLEIVELPGVDRRAKAMALRALVEIDKVNIAEAKSNQGWDRLDLDWEKYRTIEELHAKLAALESRLDGESNVAGKPAKQGGPANRPDRPTIIATGDEPLPE